MPRWRTKRIRRLSESALRLLVIAGTRPEVLKLAPVVRALREHDAFDVKACLSGQHGALARDIASEIGFSADFDLGAPTAVGSVGGSSPASLSESLSQLLSRLATLVTEVAPAGVLVQGDTTTALAGALAGFHQAVPVFHVEAGLRTKDPLRPFPEEMNRRLISRIASLHFAPTVHARQNLLGEGIAPDRVVVTGNTVVDALAAFGGSAPASPAERPMLLVTLHRREGAPEARAIGEAVRSLAGAGDADIVWIRHPNRTAEAALAALGTAPNVNVLPPQSYAGFVALMRRAHIVLTDSGGVQEEAPVLGVPVVVLRTETDRPEAVAAGNAVVVGGDPRSIVAACRELLDDPAVHASRSRAQSPFGDGGAAQRIVTALHAYFTRT